MCAYMYIYIYIYVTHIHTHTYKYIYIYIHIRSGNSDETAFKGVRLTIEECHTHATGTHLCILEPAIAADQKLAVDQGPGRTLKLGCL